MIMRSQGPSPLKKVHGLSLVPASSHVGIFDEDNHEKCINQDDKTGQIMQGIKRKNIKPYQFILLCSAKRGS